MVEICDLFEHCLRRSQVTGGHAGNEPQPFAGHSHFLPGSNRLKFLQDRFVVHGLKFKELAAAPDCFRYLVKGSSTQNIDQIRGRVLKQFEHGVESRLTQHVALVYDIDLVTAAERPEVGFVRHVFNVIDTPEPGGIHFHNIPGAAGNSISHNSRASSLPSP